MKKAVIAVMLLLCLVSGGCKTGDVSGVEKDIGSSEVYTSAEITAAMDVVKERFYKTYPGCTLTRLWYEEEHSLPQAKTWAKQYDAAECIVLLSEYTTGPEGGDGSLHPNDTYSGWNWVLVRDGKNKPWKLKTWGY